MEGRIWTNTGEGAQVYDPDGAPIGKVLVPGIVANVAFGGTKRNKLFIPGATSLHAILTMTRGCKVG